MKMCRHKLRARGLTGADGEREVLDENQLEAYDEASERFLELDITIERLRNELKRFPDAFKNGARIEGKLSQMHKMLTELIEEHVQHRQNREVKCRSLTRLNALTCATAKFPVNVSTVQDWTNWVSSAAIAIQIDLLPLKASVEEKGEGLSSANIGG